MQRFHLLLHLAQVLEHAHAFGEDGAAGERQAVLRQIALADAFGKGDVAVIERFHAAQDLEQRGLAGAVGADQARALLGRDQPVAVFEQEFVAETLAGALQLNHLIAEESRDCGRYTPSCPTV